MRCRGADCLVVALKRSNVRGAKRAGHPRRNHNGPTGNRRSPPVLTEGGSSPRMARAVWNCIPRRRSWSTVGMPIGSRVTRTSGSTSWVLRFGLGQPSLARVRSSAVSVRPSRNMRETESDERSRAGGCISATAKPSLIWRGRSIRNFGDGSTTTGVSIPPRYTRSKGIWGLLWPAGPGGNTRHCGVIAYGHGGGLCGSRSANPVCSPCGSTHAGRFSPREPYEWRRSRTVLGEPWGETPRGHLTYHSPRSKAITVSFVSANHLIPD